MYTLGIDLGSSSVKAAIVELESGKALSVVKSPEVGELTIAAPSPGFAEQHPEVWWQHVSSAIQSVIGKSQIQIDKISAVGISYQMHGLVTLDANKEVLHPAIIWCDSRAVDAGVEIMARTDEETILRQHLNTAGNFTLSKLYWLKQNKPSVFEKCAYAMLPGDYIAYKLTGEISTTISGLSEGILWDFQAADIGETILAAANISKDLFPSHHVSAHVSGVVHSLAAKQTGLKEGTPVTYRAGDQPNNAVAMGVFEPGEIAATAGTSGVVYAIQDTLKPDSQQRINGFAHVNHQKDKPRIGQLMCINGTGIFHAWVKNHVAPTNVDYLQIEHAANSVAAGSDGLTMLPFGNGAERILQNRQLGASMHGLEFTRHTRAHLYRSCLEGLAFSFVYGMEIFGSLGIEPQRIRAGNDNLFQSSIFSQTIADLASCTIEIVESTGAIGAAMAAGLAINAIDGWSSISQRTPTIDALSPNEPTEALNTAYERWKTILNNQINVQQ